MTNIPTRTQCTYKLGERVRRCMQVLTGKEGSKGFRMSFDSTLCPQAVIIMNIPKKAYASNTFFDYAYYTQNTMLPVREKGLSLYNDVGGA